jgi:hypothetical protein
MRVAPMIRVVTVGFDLPVNEARRITFESTASFLDADVILLDPRNIATAWPPQRQAGDGMKHYSDLVATEILRLFDHRRDEIQKLLSAGKIVVAFLRPFEEVCLDFGGRHMSVSNYHWLPNPLLDHLRSDLRPGDGDNVVVANGATHWSTYHRVFGGELRYHAYLDARLEDLADFDVLFVNPVDLTVGLGTEVGGGYLLLLPDYYPQREEEHRKFFGWLVQQAKEVLQAEETSVPPDWVASYPTPGEDELSEKVRSLGKEIDDLRRAQDQVKSELVSRRDYRRLLYEKGHPLQDQVVEALRLLGFKADGVRKADLEHDVLMESPEGRALGEVEGKDRSAIDIDKLNQLMRALGEDFKENDEYAKGVLIGNPFRELDVPERPDPFTEKVLLSARRFGYSLLETHQLFRAATYILANPDDEDSKERFRRLILGSTGEIVDFRIHQGRREDPPLTNSGADDN